MRTSGLVDNVMISTKGTDIGLDKLENVISMKNLKRGRILSDNFCDEVGYYGDNLRVVAKKLDPTHTCNHQQTQYNNDDMKYRGYKRDLKHHSEEDQKV